jgi:hypothetical protein
MKNLADWFHWIPRSLCILATLFISVFALDAFAPGLTLWEQIRDFLIHLFPTYILLFLLWLAWVKEQLGGWLFIAFGVLTGIAVFMLNYNRTGSFWMALGIVFIINIPVVMVGVLFLISYHLKSK